MRGVAGLYRGQHQQALADLTHPLAGDVNVCVLDTLDQGNHARRTAFCGVSAQLDRYIPEKVPQIPEKAKSRTLTR
ncbi:hypothetical protein GCM10010960_16490 [Arenimonas maotaiensis]|uniref:Uncharacterized protein n=1 Tax=Arenimonas maotaiensis TaxID=1446479 RepID=A0A917FQ76_9GAMM|nr:hypothetical protein GCM10010960_16490 [Arenimonas maotaiensis]